MDDAKKQQAKDDLVALGEFLKSCPPPLENAWCVDCGERFPCPCLTESGESGTLAEREPE